MWIPESSFSMRDEGILQATRIFRVRRTLPEALDALHFRCENTEKYSLGLEFQKEISNISTHFLLTRRIFRTMNCTRKSLVPISFLVTHLLIFYSRHTSFCSGMKNLPRVTRMVAVSVEEDDAKSEDQTFDLEPAITQPQARLAVGSRPIYQRTSSRFNLVRKAHNFGHMTHRDCEWCNVVSRRVEMASWRII